MQTNFILLRVLNPHLQNARTYPMLQLFLRMAGVQPLLLCLSHTLTNLQLGVKKMETWEILQRSLDIVSASL